MNCLYCHQHIDHPLTWSTLFHFSQPVLCDHCTQQLEAIAGPICEKCGRPIQEQGICPDCQFWLQSPTYQDALTYNRALYSYNESLQDIITQWKYRGDYQLITIFKPLIEKQIGKQYDIKKLTVVPIPLTAKRLHERAFNQSQAIADTIASKWQRPVAPILQRHPNHSEKQSKKSRKQRISTKNPFFATETLQTDFLVVDDIYTTGMTIHHAAVTLKAAGAKKIYSFTLIR